MFRSTTLSASLRRLLFLSVIFSANCLFLCRLHAQSCTLICNQQVQVSLNGSGQALITEQLLAPGAASSCPGALEINLFNQYGQPVGNPLTCSSVGQTVKARLRHAGTGNFCLTDITVTDQLPPLINAPTRFIACGKATDPTTLGTPAFSDNCTQTEFIETFYIDNRTDLPCGTIANGKLVTARIDRTWVAEDAAGNSAQAVETIWIRQAVPTDVVFPANLDGITVPALSCGQDPNDLSLTGQPTIEGAPIDPLHCDLAVTFSDQVIPVCPPAGKLILRTWTLIDFCTSGLMQRVQQIRVEDKQAPVLTLPADITVNTLPTACFAVLELPQAQATDNCSTVSIQAQWAFGAGYGPYSNIPTGTHTATYTATDACGNKTSAAMQITVLDAAPPQVVCNTSIQVSLGTNGKAQVFATTLDAGSFDNCGGMLTFEISRDKQNFFSFVEVSCADLSAPVPMTLRVKDENGLENECDVEVQVRDLLKPNIICPPAAALSCKQNPTDLALTGNAQANDNCLLANVTFSDKSTIDPCNTGNVVRTWLATDAAGNTRSCVQQITLTAVNTIQVVFPPDLTVNTCTNAAAYAPTAAGQPTVTGQSCSTPSVTFTDEVFSNTPGLWRRILRKWKVIEWCSYNVNTGGTGYWEHTQRIDILDQQPPILYTPASVTVNPNLADCKAEVNLAPASADDCSMVAISNNSAYSAAPAANASGVYPLGIHTIVFTAVDEFGKSAQQTITVTVQDTERPKAVCTTNLTVAVEPNGWATVKPSDLNGGSTDNCTPAQQLQLSAYPLSFSCAQLGKRGIVLRVTDQQGFTDSCMAAVSIIDPFHNCKEKSFPVSGRVQMEHGPALPNLVVNAQSATQKFQVFTDTLGTYSFPELPADTSFHLMPLLNTNWLNGVTTYDLVLISRHILGLDVLNTPYKMLAADANRSGSITSFDIVQLRKLILGVFDTLPGNTSWRFVPADHVFIKPTNPFAFPFPEKFELTTLGQAYTDRNFVAIKVGDVNLSCNPVENRSPQDTAYISLHPLPGRRLAVCLPQAARFSSIQFELKFHSSAFSGNGWYMPSASGLSEENFHLQRNGFAFSWNESESGFGLMNDTLVVLQLNAEYSPRFVSLAGERIQPEAYLFYDEDRPLTLAIADRPTEAPAAGVSLFPNPFSDKTILDFYAEENGLYRLQISSTDGRLCYAGSLECTAGRNRWQLPAADLGPAGLYNFQLIDPKGRGVVLRGVKSF